MGVWQIVVLSIYILGVILVPISMGAFFPKHASKMDVMNACCGLAFIAISWPLVVVGVLALCVVYGVCLLPALLMKWLLKFGGFIGEKVLKNLGIDDDDYDEDDN